MIVNVYVNEHKNGVQTGNRLKLEAEVVRKTATSIWVKLPNGDVVKRKMKRDIVSMN